MTSAHEILYLTQDDVVQVGLSENDVLRLVRTALTEHGCGRYEMPPKIGLHPQQDTLMHAMPAYVPGAAACGPRASRRTPNEVCPRHRVSSC